MKKYTRLKNFILTHETAAVLLLILAGALLRCAAIGSNPVGLNQDEASAGYEALALLRWGTDRNGYSWPVLFVSWGSGQNVLYSYLTIPVFAVFGKGVWQLRLTAAVFGTLTLPVFWALARKLRGRGCGLAALLLLAVNPWHIMISRWALESNLLPFFLLLGVYLAVLSVEKPRALIGAGAAFGLSLYAYGTAYIFLPLFLICAAAILARGGALKMRSFLPAAAVFFALAFPITLCNVINVLKLPEMKLFGVFSLPRLTETRQAATTVFGGGGLSAALGNLKNFFTLLWTQSDGLIYNARQPGGLYYFFGLPLAALGLGTHIYGRIKKGERTWERLPLAALLSAVAAAALIEVNINRVNMAFLPLLYFQAVGLWRLMAWLGDFGAVPAVGVAAACAVFVNGYFTDFRIDLSRWFFEGLGEAAEYAGALDAETVYVSRNVNAPYIYVLFYNEIPPEEFLATVRYLNPAGAFRWVDSFGKYRFYSYPEGDAVYVLEREGSEGFSVLETFGNYVVARR